MACVEASLPVVRGEQAIALERQVRIAAAEDTMLLAIKSRHDGPWEKSEQLQESVHGI